MGLVLLALAAPLLAAPPAPPPPTWEAAVDRVLPAVVTIRAASPRAFDTDFAGSSTATAFVVDRERGILLTNRHVVEPGPVVAEAVLANHEEIPIVPIYRDPIHDFGFYRFNPADVRFQALPELELAPAAARVGVEIRVLGSDAGEKVSILSGTLARLDRDAPFYGTSTYNDFNTFYYQAASGTSGGSSGSPVFDIHGRVVALNAGASRQAATSFYLPLDRVERALRLLQAGEPVPRGGWQTVFRHRTWDEVRRLGLRPETEAALRAEDRASTGLLVVEEVLRDGPAHGKLEPGDVLLRVEGRPIRGFVPLEAMLDDAVGRPLTVEVERGGRPVTVGVPVEDLHRITPDRYLEVGGAVIHPLSFQQARNAAVPVRGLYVASPGFQFENSAVGRGAVIVEANGTPVDTVEGLLDTLDDLADRSWLTVRWFALEEPNRLRQDVVNLDRRFHPLQLCTRDDRTGAWPCVEARPAPPAVWKPDETPLPPAPAGPPRKVQPSLVWIQNEIPFRIEGAYAGTFSGSGVVVDAARGWVLTDRDTVPMGLGVISVTFGGSVTVPADVVAIHPVHNLALLQVDPALIGRTPVAALPLAPRPPAVDDPVWHVGLNRFQETVGQKTKVESREPLWLPVPSHPFFRDTNLSVLGVADTAPAVGGPLVDTRGRMVALWASFVDGSGDKNSSFFRGIPVDVVADFLDRVGRGETDWPTPGVEVVPVPLSRARALGLPPAVVERVVAERLARPQVWRVERVTAGSPASVVVRPGDLVIEADGAFVREPRDLERAAASGAMALRLVRGGEERSVEVEAHRLPALGVQRFVQWAGAVVHATPVEVAAQHGVPPEGVYVTWTWNGSPVARYGVRPTWRIVAVDDQPVRDLDAFLAAVSGRPDRSAVRLRVVNLDGRPAVMTLKLDLAWWPTLEFRREADGWVRLPR